MQRAAEHIGEAIREDGRVQWWCALQWAHLDENETSPRKWVQTYRTVAELCKIVWNSLCANVGAHERKGCTNEGAKPKPLTKAILPQSYYPTIMANAINILLGEPYTGATKFQVGDTLRDAMFPSSERLTISSIEVVQSSPWHTEVVYNLVSNRGKEFSGLQNIMEQEGRFVVESIDELTRKVWNGLVERVKNGQLTRLQ